MLYASLKSKFPLISYRLMEISKASIYQLSAHQRLRFKVRA